MTFRGDLKDRDLNSFQGESEMRKGLVILTVIFIAVVFGTPAAADENSTGFYSAKAVISSFISSDEGSPVSSPQRGQCLCEGPPPVVTGSEGSAPAVSSSEAPERIKIDITVFEGDMGDMGFGGRPAGPGNVRTISLGNPRTLGWGNEQTPGWAKLHEFEYETHAAAISFDGVRYKVVGVSLYVVEDDPTPRSVLR